MSSYVDHRRAALVFPFGVVEERDGRSVRFVWVRRCSAVVGGVRRWSARSDGRGGRCGARGVLPSQVRHEQQHGQQQQRHAAHAHAARLRQDRLPSLGQLPVAAAVAQARVAHAVVRQRAAAAGAHVARVRQPREGLAHEAPLAAAVVGQHARLAVLHLALAARAAPGPRLGHVLNVERPGGPPGVAGGHLVLHEVLLEVHLEQALFAAPLLRLVPRRVRAAGAHWFRRGRMSYHNLWHSENDIGPSCASAESEESGGREPRAHLAPLPRHRHTIARWGLHSSQMSLMRRNS